MDIATIKQRQQAAWASGDYAAVGTRLLLTAELLGEAVDLRAGQQVLDVACGNGNAALAAARRFCQVTGIDYVPALLERARQRAEAEGLEVAFQQADAEALPFPDDAFDAVLSTCGAMFAPDQERTAAELLPVCRPGGRIGVVNWVPDGYVGEWRFPSAEHQAEFFATFYGPTNKTLATLGADRAADLKADMVKVARSFDLSDDATLVLRQDYLEAVIRKPAP